MTSGRNLAFAKMAEVLAQDKLIAEPEARKRIKRKDAVERLTVRVEQFKKMHSGCENNLSRTLEKVEYDKFILLKERLTCVWNEELYDKTGDLNIEEDLRKLKVKRQKLHAS